MKLADYCDAINVQLSIIRYPNQGERWTAKFDGGEIVDGGCLTSKYGEGDSPQIAMLDYVNAIKGKKMVFGAYTPNRKEFVVPISLEVD